MAYHAFIDTGNTVMPLFTDICEAVVRDEREPSCLQPKLTSDDFE